MDNYIEIINQIADELEKLSESSEVFYDQSYHQQIMDRANDTFIKIQNDESIKDDDKQLLFLLISSFFEVAKREMEGFM